jgi:hypothetical protein
MVLALPMLLFIMALMANFGTYACWKIRGLSAARAAVWGNRWPRSTAGNPQLAYWLPPATAASAGPTNTPAPVDDPRVDQPIGRGADIMNAQVNTNLLDPDRGFLTSTATLTRNWPMMSKWPAYHLQATTCLVDDDWQYSTAAMGMSSNQTHRIPILYTLPEAPASLSNAYIQAIVAIMNSPTQQQLTALNGYYPVFPSNLCDMDRADYQQPVQNLIDHIQGKPKPHVAGVAETMARAYIAMFTAEEKGASQSQAAQLQTWISELQQFIQSLQSG